MSEWMKNLLYFSVEQFVESRASVQTLLGSQQDVYVLDVAARAEQLLDENLVGQKWERKLNFVFQQQHKRQCIDGQTHEERGHE